jgi:hypothetical protein
MGYTPGHHPFIDGLSIINPPFRGSPIDGNPHIILYIQNWEPTKAYADFMDI